MCPTFTGTLAAIIPGGNFHDAIRFAKRLQSGLPVLSRRLGNNRHQPRHFLVGPSFNNVRSRSEHDVQVVREDGVGQAVDTEFCRSSTNDAKIRDHWWTRKGSVRHLFDDDSLDAAVIYTLEAQDIGGSKANNKR